MSRQDVKAQCCAAPGATLSKLKLVARFRTRNNFSLKLSGKIGKFFVCFVVPLLPRSPANMPKSFPLECTVSVIFLSCYLSVAIIDLFYYSLFPAKDQQYSTRKQICLAHSGVSILVQPPGSKGKWICWPRLSFHSGVPLEGESLCSPPSQQFTLDQFITKVCSGVEFRPSKHRCKMAITSSKHEDVTRIAMLTTFLSAYHVEWLKDVSLNEWSWALCQTSKQLRKKPYSDLLKL